MVEKMSLGFPAPKALATEILDQALELTARLENLFEERGEPLDSQILQEALIHLAQSLLIGLTQTLRHQFPHEELEDFANQVFLELGRLTLMEFIQREPTEEEWEYFLTYFRSHFELLREEMGEETSYIQEAADLLEETQKHLERLLTRFFS